MQETLTPPEVQKEAEEKKEKWETNVEEIIGKAQWLGGRNQVELGRSVGAKLINEMLNLSKDGSRDAELITKVDEEFRKALDKRYENKNVDTDERERFNLSKDRYQVETVSGVLMGMYRERMKSKK